MLIYQRIYIYIYKDENMGKKNTYVFRKNKAVKGLAIAAIGTVLSVTGTTVSAEVLGQQNTPISRADYNSLSESEKALIRHSQIDQKMSWVNEQTGKVEYITEYVLVYENGCAAVKPSKGMKQLPKTGSESGLLYMAVGVGLLALSGYVLYKNKKSGKYIAMAVLMAVGETGAGVVSASELGFIDVTQTISIDLDGRFQFKAPKDADNCWIYVGYIPKIATKDVPKPIETTTVASATSATTESTTASTTVPTDETTTETTTESTSTRATETTSVATTVKQSIPTDETVTSTTKVVVETTTESTSAPKPATPPAPIDETGSSTTTVATTETTISETTLRATIADTTASTTESTTETTTTASTTESTTESTTVPVDETTKTETTTETTTESTTETTTESTTTETTTVETVIEKEVSEVKGNVITVYINEVTGERIVNGSNIITDGVVSRTETTIVKNAKTGEVISRDSVKTPTGLTYDTTADKQARDAEIAPMRVKTDTWIDPSTGQTHKIGDVYESELPTVYYSKAFKEPDLLGRKSDPRSWSMPEADYVDWDGGPAHFASFIGYLPKGLYSFNPNYLGVDTLPEEEFFSWERETTVALRNPNDKVYTMDGVEITDPKDLQLDQVYKIVSADKTKQTVTMTPLESVLTASYVYTKFEYQQQPDQAHVAGTTQEKGLVIPGTQIITYYYRPEFSNWTPEIIDNTIIVPEIVDFGTEAQG